MIFFQKLSKRYPGKTKRYKSKRAIGGYKCKNKNKVKKIGREKNEVNTNISIRQ